FGKKSLKIEINAPNSGSRHSYHAAKTVWVQHPLPGMQVDRSYMKNTLALADLTLEHASPQREF